MRTVFEGSFTEDGNLSVKAIFGGGLNFTSSETRKNFDITASEDQGAIGGQSGSDQGVIGDQAIEQLLVIYDK